MNSHIISPSTVIYSQQLNCQNVAHTRQSSACHHSMFKPVYPTGLGFWEKTRVFEESCQNTIKIEMFWKVEILNRFLAFHHFSFDCNLEHYIINQTQDQQIPCPLGKLIGKTWSTSAFLVSISDLNSPNYNKLHVIIFLSSLSVKFS